MLGRTRAAPRGRRKLPSYAMPQPPAVIAAVSLVSGKLRLTFPVSMTASGLPVGITNQGNAPTAITLISANVYDLTYATPPVSTNVWIIPNNVSQLRSVLGAVPAAATGVFP